MYGQHHSLSFNRAARLVKSELPSDHCHRPFAFGGLFLGQTTALRPSFVSLINTHSLGNQTLRFVRQRSRGCGFLSVSLSMKGSGEGYVRESTESWGQNGNSKGDEEEEDEDGEVEEQTVAFKGEKKVEENELGAYNTYKHLFAGAAAAYFLKERALLYSLLLTLQYGVQPLISKRCIRQEELCSWLVVCAKFPFPAGQKALPNVPIITVLLVGEHGVSNWSKPFAHFPSLRFVGLLSLVKNLNSVLHACLVSKHANLPVLPKWKALTDYGSSYRGEVIVTTSVLTCELAKAIFGLIFMAKEGTLKKLSSQWTFVGSLTASGLPAAIYALQNSLLQISYRNLDSLTFSMLNQTRIIFTALFTYIILRQRQSMQQIVALSLLILAAVFLCIGEGSSKLSSSGDPDQILFYGIVPVLVASVLSGLASALCQWATQVKKHSSYLMTIEMSIVGSLCLLASIAKSPDGEAIRQHGFFYGWTPLTLIPVISNALAGIVVGLVTSHAGGVRKVNLT
ncbi:UDP-N-acetylglucosamine transporter ROCK1 [Citrus sinensis]|uniref:UDP-N-acetylglucosamine transporter ROCK1 n=1 Tax=Citrus sinensis TaxID=2711 RepID=A0ACB8JL94_CITSI|nr:UDP-N-acetylglucosamine transporter ROCK1 [Citrus sinensis]